MKKNRPTKAKVRRQQKRSKKNLARRAALQYAKENIRYIEAARRAAQRSVPVENFDAHELTDEVEIPACDGVGNCCINRPVVLDPGDIFRIVNNQKVQEIFGIELTSDLYRGKDERSLLRYHLDKKAGVPLCVVRRDTQESGEETCAFLQQDEKGNMSCILGDDKPTVCKSNPIHRIAKKGVDGKFDGWQYVASNHVCDSCSKCGQRDPVIIEKWMVRNDMEERLSVTDLYHGLNGWLVRNVKSEEMRQLACILIFDFDSYLTEIGGLTTEKAKETRPESARSAIVTAKHILDGIINSQSKE